MLFGTTHSVRRTILLSAVAWIGVLCSSNRAADAPKTTQPPRQVAFGPAEDAVYAIRGRPLVIPMAPLAPATGPEPLAPDRPPGVTINAAPTPAECVLVRPTAVAARAGTWEPEALAWTAEALGTPDRKGRVASPGIRADEPGFWCAVVQTPGEPERPVVTLNTRSVPVIWLDEPPPMTGAGRPVRPVASPAAWIDLGDRLRPLASDPSQRWRVRLLLDRVTPAELWGANPPSEIPGRAVEAWATRKEECWRVAIEQLRQVDPVLSSDLLHTLTAIVAVPSGAVVPAWPLDDIGTERLLRSLLDPGETRSRKAELARAWLAGTPPGVAWIIDDADQAGPTIGVAEISGRRTNVTLGFGALTTAITRTVVAHESITTRVPIPARDDPDNTPDLTGVDIATDRWKRRVAVITTPVGVKPPGLLTGPFFRGWTHASWLGGRPAPATGLLATTAMLQPGAEAGSWQVFLQCASRGSEAPDDTINLWFGPFDDPACRIVIERDKEATLQLRGQAPAPVNVRTTHADDSWSVLVDVPDSAFDAGRTLLRMGVDRTARGETASWPRPMLPGQIEPGRLAIDLSTWGSLSGD